MRDRDDRPDVTLEVTIPLPAGNSLAGNLAGPAGNPLVIFAHGTGSSRHSPRNGSVARVLNESGLRTLLMDLLTEEEETQDLQTAHYRFDIEMLGERVGVAIDWAAAELNPPDIGLFGASTGAAAALVAATTRPLEVGAVVSRGGRPDLAGDSLPAVEVPTLLIVGRRDTTVLELNRQALSKLAGSGHRIEIVEGATHLFEEPGALDTVADLAASWFARHLES